MYIYIYIYIVLSCIGMGCLYCLVLTGVIAYTDISDHRYAWWHRQFVKLSAVCSVSTLLCGSQLSHSALSPLS